MRIQLIFAPPVVQSTYEVLGENIWPPLGILYLAGYVREKYPQAEINIVDGCRIGYDNTLAEITRFHPDILGISFYTMVAHGAFKVAQFCKQTLPGTLVVMGGPHATALPQDTLRQSQADLVVVGEGEETFYQIVKRWEEAGPAARYADLDGVCLHEQRDGLTVYVENPPRQFITPLDAIPLPARDLIDMSAYRGWFLTRQNPETIILSSRGCPFACTFCSNAVWKSSKPAVRFRSPASIVDEIEVLHRQFQINEVFDNADEFNCSLEQALAICREIKRRRLPITWKAQLRAKPFTEELAREMAEAGCWYVHVGVESGNEETLRGINKNITLDDVRDTCRMLQKHGIKVWALLMLYNVWEEDGQLKFEDRAMCEKTLAFAWELIRDGLANYISWSVTTPYPGSRLYDIALRHHLIKPELLVNWESWQTDDLFVMNLPGVSARDQRAIKFKGELLRMRCFLKQMDFKWKDIPFIAKRGWHVLSRALLHQQK